MNDRLKEAFDNIRAEEALKNKTAHFLAEKTRGYKKYTFFPYKQLAAAACFIFVLFGGFYVTYFIPISVISVDVNPSIEIGINRFDTVVSVKGYNDDGRALAASLDIRFLNYTDAFNRILADGHIVRYLSQDEVLTITVAGTDDKQNQKILASAESCASEHKNVYYYTGSSEDVSAAHRHGLSIGKYRVFMELQALDPNVTPGDVRNVSMREMRNTINNLSGCHEDIPSADTAVPDQNSGRRHRSGLRRKTEHQDRH